MHVEPKERYLVHFIIAFILWLLLSWSLDWHIVIVGVALSALSAFLFTSHFPLVAGSFLHPTRYFWFLIYLPIFLWYCLLANLDVAYRVLNLRMPIHPGIVKVRTKLKSDTGKTFLANSITLTPGTLTVDVIGDELYIHWINVHGSNVEERTKQIVERFENILRKVFE
jgi:multicomponent Na+:H+ antiporter subunit E